MLMKRKPKQLSGGQRQRVAVGRAIVRDPAVFLFDEPLSNLDAKLRVQTRAEISKLHQRLQSTFIYVTHDQVEAMTMATRIAVMSDGILQQIDDPQTLYDKPTNIFVAGFIGSPSMNFGEAKISKMNGDIIVDTGDTALPMPSALKDVYANHIGKEVVYGIRPEDIHDPKFTPPGVTNQSLIEAKVDVMEMMGNEVFLYLKVNDKTMIARVDPRTDYKVGDTVQVSGNTDNLHIFDKSTETALV
jgi:multiple sugar transport system ATP-binding protein